MKIRQSVLDLLEDIRTRHGGLLKAQDIVDAAKPVNSPLHRKFQWDDSKAAARHRLWQARQLITRCVQVIAPKTDATRAFVHLYEDHSLGGGYRAIIEVLSKKELREQYLDKALKEMESLKRRYGHLKELAGVFVESGKVHAKKRKAA